MFSIFDRLTAYVQKFQKGKTQQILFLINCSTIPEKNSWNKKKIKQK